MAAPLIARIMVEYAAQKGGGPPTPPGTAGPAAGVGKAVKAKTQPGEGQAKLIDPKGGVLLDAAGKRGDAAPPPAPPEGGGDEEASKKRNTLLQKLSVFGKKGIEYAKENHKGILKSASKAVGVQFTLGSILKQSQIFTGYLGTIFQLMGALVDVILAPFLPVFIPAIKHMAKFIPIVAEVAKEIFGVLSIIGKVVATVVKKVIGWTGLSKLGKNQVAGIKKALVYVIIGLFLVKVIKTLTALMFAGKQSPGELAAVTLTAAATHPGSIYVKDIMGAKGMMLGNKAAGKRGLRMGRLGMRANLLMMGMTGILARGFSMFKGGLAKLGNLVGIGNGTQTELVRGSKIAEGASVSRWGKALSWMTDLRAGMWARLGTIRTSAIESFGKLRTNLVERFNMLKTKTGEFLTKVRTNISNALETAKTKIAGAIDTAKARLADGLTNVRTKIATAVDTVRTKLNSALDTMRTKLSSGLDTVRTKIASAVDTVRTKLSTGLDTVKTKIATAVDTVRTKLSTGLDNVRNKVGDMAETVGNKVNDVKARIGDWVTTGGDKLDALRTGVIDKVKLMGDNMTTAVGKVKDGILDLPKTLSGLFGGITDALGNAFGRAKDLISGVGDKAADVARGAKNFFGGLFNKGKDMVKAGTDKVGQMVDNAGKRVNNFYGGIKRQVGSKLTALADTPAGKFAIDHMGKASKFGKGMVMLGRAMPVIGAAAEVVIGGMKVLEDVKKGRSLAQITARVVATGALATASFFDPTGITSAAASYGVHKGLDYGFDKGIGGGRRPEDETIRIIATERNIDGLDISQSTYVRNRYRLNQGPPISIGSPPPNFATD